jgi:uncharacterized protein (TIGR01777 family)
MKVAITGARGFIGRKLIDCFNVAGNKIVKMKRITDETSVTRIAEELSGVDVTINLAGAPIVSRWTKSYKKLIFDSRIVTTRKIVQAIGMLENKPNLLISASAIGIYAQLGEQFENNCQLADDYLGEICRNWELEAQKAMPLTRVAIIRMGIVLGKEGGALKRMLPVFKLGLGGKISSGRQGFSWIHINDLVRAVQFIIENPDLKGEFNFTSPEVVDNKTFTRYLAKVLKRPALFTVPSFALKLLYGEGAVAVTGGQFAPPKHLLDAGFKFDFPDLATALKDITS